MASKLRSHSSSPVGDETVSFPSGPTGEDPISAFERELLEGEGQENSEEEQ